MSKRAKEESVGKLRKGRMRELALYEEAIKNERWSYSLMLELDDMGDVNGELTKSNLWQALKSVLVAIEDCDLEVLRKGGLPSAVIAYGRLLGKLHVRIGSEG